MISPSGVVSPGSWVNLTCSSRAKPVANFTWFKINKDGLMKVSEGDFYSFNVTDGGVYYCVASNDVGNQSSSRIHLTIKGKCRTVLIQVTLIDEKWELSKGSNNFICPHVYIVFFYKQKHRG